MKKNIKIVFGVMGWAIISHAIMFGAGFVAGNQNQAKAQADIQHAVQTAVQAVKSTPSPTPGK